MTFERKARHVEVLRVHVSESARPQLFVVGTSTEIWVKVPLGEGTFNADQLQEAFDATQLSKFTSRNSEGWILGMIITFSLLWVDELYTF